MLGPRRVVALALLLLSAVVLSGCGSSLPPRALTAAQAAQVAAVPSFGVVAIAKAEYGNAGILRSQLEATGLFRTAVLEGAEGAAAADWTATLTGRCQNRRGGWIPFLPILTLGVVPEFARMELGYSFTLREAATGRTIDVPCEIKSTIGVGWLPALMNVLPGWSLKEPEETKSFRERLAYAIVSRAAP
ncbi:MAG TPA: hypothetical protein VN783_04980 [Thermoanaerobaculia bacterium]|nr:hypothetical protein [Thermoanaerobaculia bacterium]